MLIFTVAVLTMVGSLLFLRQKFRRQLEQIEAGLQQRLAVLEEKLDAKEAQLLEQTALRQQAEQLTGQLRDDLRRQSELRSKAEAASQRIPALEKLLLQKTDQLTLLHGECMQLKERLADMDVRLDDGRRQAEEKLALVVFSPRGVEQHLQGAGR